MSGKEEFAKIKIVGPTHFYKNKVLQKYNDEYIFIYCHYFSNHIYSNEY
jgi:hypothetical protein